MANTNQLVLQRSRVYPVEVFPAGIVRNTWNGSYLLPRDVRDHIAVATTTFYRDDESDRVRRELTLQNFRDLRKEGYEVIAVDGGSAESFLGQARELGVHMLPEVPHKRGEYGPGRRQAIREAAQTGRKVLVWTEPEKVPLVPDYHSCASPILLGGADSIVPLRTWQGLQSYPTQQWIEELAGARSVRDLLGYVLDLWFGPKFFHRDAAPFYLEKFESLQKELDIPDDWNATLGPSVLMHHEGGRIGDVLTQYQHPKAQTDEENGDFSFDYKRGVQKGSILAGFHKLNNHLHIQRKSLPVGNGKNSREPLA